MLSVLNTKIKEMLGESIVLAEKAVSKAQQQAAGIALAAKKSGKKPAGKGASAEMSKMSTKELEKFAGTKHKGLPAKKTDEAMADTEEGNAFGQAIRNAKKDGVQKGEKVKVGGKEYPVNTILTLIKSTSLDLVKRGVAEKYEGEYPPRSKTKMNLEQLNRK
jgi:hypothetical protein